MLVVFLLALGLAFGNPVLANDKLSVKSEDKSTANQSIQPSVDKETEQKTIEQRERILAEASAAITESRKALKALDEKKADEALKLLEVATGKMALIVARDPSLALAPIDVTAKTYDVYASNETIKEAIKQAEDYLEDGEVQKARPLVRSLASEIVIETTNIPLATYPDAIKEVVPLIDKGKIEEAKLALQVALNTLVVVKEAVIPLPVLHAEFMLKDAEKLAEAKDRDTKEIEKLSTLLDEAQVQLKKAQLLGYGDKKAFKPMYEQLDKIREKTDDGKSGKGFFDKIKKQMTDFFDRHAESQKNTPE
jgi:hypothetical protein